MLLGYDLPRDWTYGINNGEWLTPDVELLHDFEPAEQVRLAFAAGAQTIGTTTAITGQRVGALVPRVACILGLTVPIGLRVEIIGKRAADSSYTYDLGGNSQTQRVVEFADGTRGVWWLFDAGLDPIVGWQISLYNDVGGVVALDAEAQIEIGQIIVTAAADIPHELGWSYGYRSTSLRRRTLAAQLQHVSRTAYRQTRLKPVYDNEAAAHGAGLAGAEDWQRLLARFARRPFSVVVPRVLNTDHAQRLSAFGIVSNDPTIQQLVGPLWQMQEVIFEEIPALAR